MNANRVLNMSCCEDETVRAGIEQINLWFLKRVQSDDSSSAPGAKLPDKHGFVEMTSICSTVIHSGNQPSDVHNKAVLTVVHIGTPSTQDTLKLPHFCQRGILRVLNVWHIETHSGKRAFKTTIKTKEGFYKTDIFSFRSSASPKCTITVLLNEVNKHLTFRQSFSLEGSTILKVRKIKWGGKPVKYWLEVPEIHDVYCKVTQHWNPQNAESETFI